MIQFAHKFLRGIDLPSLGNNFSIVLSVSREFSCGSVQTTSASLDGFALVTQDGCSPVDCGCRGGQRWEVVLAKEVEQKVADVLLVIIVGRKNMFKGIVENCMVEPCNMNM